MAAISGIPSLLRTVADITNTVALVRADAKLVLQRFSKQQYGIFLNGKPAITIDSLVAFDYSQNSIVSQHPVEQGQFGSYNKVGTPYSARVTVARGGKDADRQAFMAALEQLVTTTDLYDVVTPQRTYTNANIERFDYSRSASSGVGLITATLYLTQIRTTAQSKTINAKSVNGADPENGGTVQVKAVTMPNIVVTQLR